MKRSGKQDSLRETVSIVIPAYNEESHLAACLDAIAAQTVRPFEVIVVDNGSADRTAEIALSYPFVRVVREKRRGVVYARNAGFDAARGAIIGRIDVDTLLAPDWVETVQAAFSGGRVDAVTGVVGFYDVPFEQLFNRVDLICRRFIARGLGRRGEMYLYGGNMAISRQAWRSVRGLACRNRAFHEDIDLGAHFAHSGALIRFDARLKARVSARRIDSPPGDYYFYVFANSRTYAAHGLAGRFYMYPVELLVAVFYPLLRLLYRSYDSKTGKLSVRRIFSASRTRVSPVAGVSS